MSVVGTSAVATGTSVVAAESATGTVASAIGAFATGAGVSTTGTEASDDAIGIRAWVLAGVSRSFWKKAGDCSLKMFSISSRVAPLPVKLATRLLLAPSCSSVLTTYELPNLEIWACTM